jgi:hypothetical protein
LSRAKKYQQLLGEALADQLGGEFKFYRSNVKLRRENALGHDVIVVGGSTKWSPHISVDYYFGKRFDRIRRIEKELGMHPMPMHIQQYSPNVGNMKGLKPTGPYSWTANITESLGTLPTELAHSIREIAFPFFERFHDLESSRDAFIANDSWCFGAAPYFWHALFKMDTALGDIEHFEKWSQCLEAPYLEQAQEALRKYYAAESIASPP